MKVKRSYPPNIDAIQKKFPDLPSGVVFTYGNILYNPSGGPPTKDLIAHEKVHAQQQGDNPQGWWDKYLTSDEFRLDQEVEAYRAQYKFFKKHNKIKSRLGWFLDRIASDLSGPIYGGIISFEEAREKILG